MRLNESKPEQHGELKIYVDKDKTRKGCKEQIDLKQIQSKKLITCGDCIEIGDDGQGQLRALWPPGKIQTKESRAVSHPQQSC